MIKKIIPSSVKIKIHLLKHFMRDVFNGSIFLYAKKRQVTVDYPFSQKISQELKPNDAKKHNLLIAIKSIELFSIKPGEIFSFWRAVGSPTQKKGFVNSRSLVNGKIAPSIGGGLCQLSGLIYYASLHANLKVIERHNHSRDIYTNETRFTPLGSDATVAYGYKDLRIKNNLKTPIKFTFTITDDKLNIFLNLTKTIERKVIEFEQITTKNNDIKVTTLINSEATYTSIYTQ